MAAASGKHVTIFGGSGFVGREVASQFSKKGWHVRVAVRHPELMADKLSLAGNKKVKSVKADICSRESVLSAIEGADAVVNLVGILFPTSAQGFNKAHVEGAETVAKAAADAGIVSFVHMSALGADQNSPSIYARTKAEGELLVKKHIKSAVILRPSVIFGEEDEFFNRFADMSAYLPFLPLIGGGKMKFEPVFVGDVASAIVAAAEGKAKQGGVYELGGPDIMSLQDVYIFLLKVTKRKRILLPLPFVVAKIQGFFLGLLPNPLLTIDQVKLLENDNVVSARAKKAGLTLKGLKIVAHCVGDVVPSYLKKEVRRSD